MATEKLAPKGEQKGPWTVTLQRDPYRAYCLFSTSRSTKSHDGSSYSSDKADHCTRPTDPEPTSTGVEPVAIGSGTNGEASSNDPFKAMRPEGDDPFAGQRPEGDSLGELGTSPTAGSPPARDRRMSKEWDASKVSFCTLIQSFESSFSSPEKSNADAIETGSTITLPETRRHVLSYFLSVLEPWIQRIKQLRGRLADSSGLSNRLDIRHSRLSRRSRWQEYADCVQGQIEGEGDFFQFSDLRKLCD
jgi:hypothetical protein